MTDDRHRSRPRVDAVRLELTVLRCQAGDERAFAALFDQFGAKTLRYLRGLVGEDADDVQQEVWLAVFKGIATLANPGAFRTWLFQTTRHRALDILRSRRRDHQRFDDVAVEEIGEADEPGETLTFNLSEETLAAALAAIPPPQREVLLLRYRDDLTYEEIAVVVGCPIGTVRTRLHHAKRRLRDLFHREGP
jgi:RNA polymerase sigma-70 factor (ECF subfamily)